MKLNELSNYIKRDFLKSSGFLIFLTTILASIFTIVTTKLIAVSLPAEDVASFLLIKRVTPFLVTFILFGVPIALPVYLSKYPYLVKPIFSFVVKRGAIFFILTLVVTILIPGLMVYATGQDTPGNWLIAAFYLQVFALVLYTIILGFLSGVQKYKRVAFLQFFALGFATLTGGGIAFFAPSWGLLGVLFVSNSAMILFILFIILDLKIIFSDVINKCMDIKDKISFSTKEFNIYSFKRLIADLCIGFFLALPGALVTTKIISQEAVIFNFSFVIIGILMTINSPFNTIMLPKLPGRFDQMEKKQVFNFIMKYLILFSIIIICICILLFFVKVEIIYIFLSQEYVKYYDLLNFSIIASGGYVMYSISCLLIDSLYKTPYQVISIVMATSIFLTGFYCLQRPNINYYMGLLAFSCFCLGAINYIVLIIKTYWCYGRKENQY